MSAQRKTGLFAQTSNKGTLGNKNCNYCRDYTSSKYRNVSRPKRGKQKSSGCRAMKTIVKGGNIGDSSNKNSVGNLHVECLVTCVRFVKN
jgi:hypothetical protein